MKAGLNLIEASELLANNETSSVELTKIYLDNINKKIDDFLLSNQK